MLLPLSNTALQAYGKVWEAEVTIGTKEKPRPFLTYIHIYVIYISFIYILYIFPLHIYIYEMHNDIQPCLM